MCLSVPYAQGLDVKHMCLAWLKKDGERAKAVLAKRERDDCEKLVLLVREILAAEAPQAS